jgi:RNA polymerase sigma-70 factor (ECF subfamily)
MTFDSSSGIWNRFGRQALDGDSEALGKLLECFRPALLSTARRSVSKRLQSLVGASDIVQLTCADAHVAVKRVKASDSRQFKGWLMRLLKNNLIDAHRQFVVSKKRSKLREVGNEGLLSALEARDPCGLEAALKREEVEILHACIERLGSPYRELLRWHMIEGKSDQEIGQLVDRTREAVRMALNRSKAALRREVLSTMDA